jgi:hypothetical protein
MKKNLYYLVLLLTLSSCLSPEKLLEKGRVDDALKRSLSLLSNGKVKTSNVVALEEATYIIAQRDEAQVQYWLGQRDSSLWPLVYEYALLVDGQQEEVRQVEKRLKAEGYRPRLTYYPAKEMITRARGASAYYYYGTVQRMLPDARSGDRMVARAAFDSIQLCRQYIPDFKNAAELEEELFDLGLTHILIRPRAGHPDTEWMRDIMLLEQDFPQQNGWGVLHHTPPQQAELHYLLDYYITDYYVSWDEEEVSTCENTEEVEDGVIIVEEWDEEDSCYVKVEKPVIIEVTVRVTEVEQSKYAKVQLRWQLRRLEDESVLYEDNLRGWEEWSNEYDVVSGDVRALDLCCDDDGGYPAAYPSNGAMLEGAAWSARRRFWKAVDKKPWLDNPDN